MLSAATFTPHVKRKNLTLCSRETRKKGNWQTVQTQIRRRRTRRLIRVSTVCKLFSRFSLGLCKSHSRVYLKLKLQSSNIWCGRVYSVYNGLSANMFELAVRITVDTFLVFRVFGVLSLLHYNNKFICVVTISALVFISTEQRLIHNRIRHLFQPKLGIFIISPRKQML